MEDEIKVSELPEATQLNDDDIIMIVQNSANKKIKKQNLFLLEFEEIEEE